MHKKRPGISRHNILGKFTQKVRRETIMGNASILPIILYNNAQETKDLAWGTEPEMERLKLVAEGNDNEGNNERSEIVREMKLKTMSL